VPRGARQLEQRSDRLPHPIGEAERGDATRHLVSTFRVAKQCSGLGRDLLRLGRRARGDAEPYGTPDAPRLVVAPQRRLIPATQDLRAEAQEVFAEWLDDAARKPY